MMINFSQNSEGLCNKADLYIAFSGLIGFLVISSKRDNQCLPKGAVLGLSNTKGRALGQGRLTDSTSFASWALAISLVCSTKPEDWGSVQLKCCNTGQILHIWCRICHVRWVHRSLWSSVGIPPARKIFSRCIVVTTGKHH